MHDILPAYQHSPEDHGREGSIAACAVLVLLARHPHGLSLADLVTLLGLPSATLRQALIGLSERRRIKSVGHGMGARWYTMRHAAAIMVQP